MKSEGNPSDPPVESRTRCDDEDRGCVARACCAKRIDETIPVPGFESDSWNG